MFCKTCKFCTSASVMLEDVVFWWSWMAPHWENIDVELGRQKAGSSVRILRHGLFKVLWKDSKTIKYVDHWCWSSAWFLNQLSVLNLTLCQFVISYPQLPCSGLEPSSMLALNKFQDFSPTIWYSRCKNTRHHEKLSIWCCAGKIALFWGANYNRSRKLLIMP